jgi:hypothetical protein
MGPGPRARTRIYDEFVVHLVIRTWYDGTTKSIGDIPMTNTSKKLVVPPSSKLRVRTSVKAGNCPPMCGSNHGLRVRR